MSSLFANFSHIVLDDESGSVRYFPDCVAPALAQRWFETLREQVAWNSFRRVMYEREVDVPRLVATFDLNAAHVPEPIRAARAVAERFSAHVFNSVGVNRYRDGNDSVAPHNDRLQDLVEDEPIALLSFGGTRRMLIRSKRPGEPAVPIDLEAGSLLVMSHASQLHYTHGVAKTKAKVDPRISVALRVRPRG